MLRSLRTTRHAGVFALLVAASRPGLLTAQAAPTTPAAAATTTRGSEVVLFLSGDQRPQLRMAFPAFTEDPSTATVRPSANEIEATLRADLADSGVFRLHGPADFTTLTLTGDLAKDADAYRSLADEVLLTATVKAEGGKVVLEGRVFDLASRQIILGKRYAGETGWARRIAHTFADEIVRQFTGQPGIALTQIAFSSERSGSKEIFLMDADGSNQRPISAHHSISLSPSWMPRGDALAYVSFFGGPPGVYFADLASGRKRPLVTDGSFNASPAVSPDGSRVAFARSVDGNIEVFLADVQGGNLRRLTNSPGIDTSPRAAVAIRRSTSWMRTERTAAA
jgi:TolB protein